MKQFGVFKHSCKLFITSCLVFPLEATYIFALNPLRCSKSCITDSELPFIPRYQNCKNILECITFIFRLPIKSE